MSRTPPMTPEEFREYVAGLQVGEKVIETGQCCMTGMKGTVYISENEGPTLGSKCVKWENGMGTSVTWGTRRIADTAEADKGDHHDRDNHTNPTAIPADHRPVGEPRGDAGCDP